MSSCPNCNADLQPSDETCPVCGEEVSNEEASRGDFAQEDPSDPAWYDKG